MTVLKGQLSLAQNWAKRERRPPTRVSSKLASSAVGSGRLVYVARSAWRVGALAALGGGAPTAPTRRSGIVLVATILILTPQNWRLPRPGVEDLSTLPDLPGELERWRPLGEVPLPPLPGDLA